MAAALVAALPATVRGFFGCSGHHSYVAGQDDADSRVYPADSCAGSAHRAGGIGHDSSVAHHGSDGVLDNNAAVCDSNGDVL